MVWQELLKLIIQNQYCTLMLLFSFPAIVMNIGADIAGMEQ